MIDGSAAGVARGGAGSVKTHAERGPLAQRSELPAHNRLVPGSNPGGPIQIRVVGWMMRGIPIVAFGLLISGCLAHQGTSQASRRDAPEAWLVLTRGVPLAQV